MDIRSTQPVPSKTSTEVPVPTDCAYAPPGEYMKDQTRIYHDDWWHLYSISGTAGYYHGYTGNNETTSWSISRNLVAWEFRGHILHASQRNGTFDQHEIWAPYCIEAYGRFYLFYTGVIQPVRLMEYAKLGHDHPVLGKGHRQTQGLAISEDLTRWDKVADPVQGLGIPGRDSHVVRDEENQRWLLYSTGGIVNGVAEAYVSQSQNLLDWEFLGVCARFPEPYSGRRFGGTTESLTVMKHPLNGKWIVLANFQYALSEDPTSFLGSELHLYDREYQGKPVEIGFAGEMIEWQHKWYRSGVIGRRDYWKLGFTEIEWMPDSGFRVVAPSIMGITDASLPQSYPSSPVDPSV